MRLPVRSSLIRAADSLFSLHIGFLQLAPKSSIAQSETTISAPPSRRSRQSCSTDMFSKCKSFRLALVSWTSLVNALNASVGGNCMSVNKLSSSTLKVYRSAPNQHMPTISASPAQGDHRRSDHELTSYTVSSSAVRSRIWDFARSALDVARASRPCRLFTSREDYNCCRC
jgi:hypothetical protein